jgi:hypothetical protein
MLSFVPLAESVKDFIENAGYTRWLVLMLEPHAQLARAWPMMRYEIRGN